MTETDGESRDMADVYGETRDNVGKPGDADYPFSWGHPREYLTLMVQARCTIMRGLVHDMNHAPLSIRAQLRFSGDDDWCEPTATGLYVPIAYEPEDA